MQISNSTAKAMRRIIDYAIKDERADFESADPEQRHNHIFLALRQIDNELTQKGY